MKRSKKEILAEIEDRWAKSISGVLLTGHQQINAPIDIRWLVEESKRLQAKIDEINSILRDEDEE